MQDTPYSLNHLYKQEVMAASNEMLMNEIRFRAEMDKIMRTTIVRAIIV